VAVVASSRNDLTQGLKSDGSIVAWNYYNDFPEVPSPNRDFVAIAVSNLMYQGLKADGSIVTWGNYSSYYYDPSPVPNQGFVALSGDGSVLALGDAGQLGVTLTPPEAVAVGARWRLAGEKTWYSWKESGTTVTRAVGTAQLELNDDFPGWYAPSSGETIAIQKDGLTSITVVYLPCQSWPLFVKAENGSVIKSPSKTYFRDGSTVTLTATPNSGYHFTEWTGDLTTTTQNPIVLTMDSTKTLTARFAINEYHLSVEATGTTGTVSVSPEQATYRHGSLITLTATPAPGCRFVRWEGDVAEEYAGNNPLQLNLGRDSVFRAVFEEIIPPVLSFSINNGLPTTVNPAVTLPNVCEGATSATHSYMASESADFTSATWLPYASVPLFVLSSGAGEKTVYFKVKNSVGAESAVTSDTIRLHSPKSIVSWENDRYPVPEPNQDFVAVIVGGGNTHRLGLKSDGSIVRWGPFSGPLPTPNQEFVAIAAGDGDWGLKSDGSVVKLEDTGNAYPFTTHDFVAISGAHDTSMALKSDCSVVARQNGTIVSVPEPNRDFVAIAAGYHHYLALKLDGSVVSWGIFPEPVPEPNRDFMAISAGVEHNLALKSDGSIVVWGGTLTVSAMSPRPTAISSLSLREIIIAWG
jgi:hypothetical protein